MNILSDDIKLLRSAVMADVPEGGGAITNSEILDGGSNTIFPDISELDRALGAAKLRQIAAAVRTLGNPVYMGANVILADPPADPRVSVTLFAARPFELRTSAVSRVESYLTAGSEWAGFLLANHLQGQRTVQIFQREVSEPPLVGQTLVLTHNEGLSTQLQQYVRVIALSSVVREFTYDTSAGPQDYKARVVTCEISDALRHDFAGSPPARTFARAASGTKIRETTVADAGTYAGASRLTQEAAVGDFSVRVASIFTQLVPSAQTPIPMADLRTNGLSGALVVAGDSVTLNTGTVFHTGQPLYLGAAVYPGTLSIVRSGVTLVDSGERLMQGGAQVGTVDHAAGIAALTSDVWGTSAGSFVVTFKPATQPDLVRDQFLIRITAETRARAYAFVLPNVPLAGTLVVSYLAQGRWYVLRDDGSGALSGADAAHGVGTVSSSAGVTLSLGALPDVGSAIMVQFAQDVASTVRPGNAELLAGGRLYAPINTSGAASEEPGAKAIKPGKLVLEWEHDGTSRLAVDNGLGAITGDAAGTVEYAAGVVRWSPNEMPAPGTPVLMSIEGATPTLALNVSLETGNLGETYIAAGSVRMVVDAVVHYSLSGVQWAPPRQKQVTVYDRAGVLYLQDEGVERVCGSVDYETGDISTIRPVVLPVDDWAAPVKDEPIPQLGGAVWTHRRSWDTAGAGRQRTLYLPLTANVSLAAASASASNVSTTVSAYRAQTLALPSKRLRGVSFSVGASRYVQLADDTLVRDPSPTTGGGTPAGSVAAALSAVSVLSWPVGASPVLQGWRGVLTAPAQGAASAGTGFTTVFRIPAVPLQSGSVSVQVTMQDGTVVNAAAGTDGKINHTRLKGLVDHQYGLVELYGVNPDGATELAVDLSHLGISGLGTMPADLMLLESARYSAVSFSYMPLDAALIGLDPVRLPSDGRAPIYRKGGVAVVGNTGTITANVSNGQTVNCARVRLSRVRVFGDDGDLVSGGYTADLEGGTVTFADVSGYAQPVTIEHRVEDMAVVSEVDINGELRFTRPLTHVYPVGSVVSSAIMGSEIGSNLFARVSRVFDQATWTNVWSDDVIGSGALASFNHAQYPITTSNAGAVTERWIVRLLSTTTFEVIGENLGNIATGNTATDLVILDPDTGQLRLHIPALGWGAGWAAGNVLRINTIDAMLRVWALMTVAQGPSTVASDSWQLLARGSVDTP